MTREDAIAMSLDALNIDGRILDSKENRFLDAMVATCRETGELATISQSADRAGLNRNTCTGIVKSLVDQGRILKIGPGQYIPNMETYEG